MLAIFQVGKTNARGQSQWHVSMGTGASDDGCSDTLTLPIGNCLFYYNAGIIFPFFSHYIAFIPIHTLNDSNAYMLVRSISVINKTAYKLPSARIHSMVSPLTDWTNCETVKLLDRFARKLARRSRQTVAKPDGSFSNSHTASKQNLFIHQFSIRVPVQRLTN